MCGIAGFIDLACQTSSEEQQVIVERMANTLRHRGPDDSGVWVDPSAGIALGHRRLAILDVSDSGHQPMLSASKRYVVVYNGEIYNYLDLLRELQRTVRDLPTFRGHSDTEVLLTCFDRWGVESSIPRLNGMFAFAVWDRQERTLHLCRDRLGEKPLYYGWMANFLLFGSELKALCAHPECQFEINRDALAIFLRHNCIPSPHSIYQGICKLPPGTYLRVTNEGRANSAPIAYWSLKEAAERGLADPFRGTEAEAVEQTEELLRNAVKIRLLSDVPLGAFLSGGVDSSTVTALMQSQSTQPVKTFSIGLRETRYNEADDAAAVARHLGTEHREFYATPAEALAVIPRLPKLYDEPFADSSQIPTFLISQWARQYVTVGLSGDGGDEVFGGYNRHVWSKRVWNAVRWLPRFVRRAASAAILSNSAENWDTLFGSICSFLPKRAKHRNLGYKLHKVAGVLGLQDQAAMYVGIASHWMEPSTVVLGAREPATILTTRETWAKLPNFTHQMMCLDAATYLPDDILVKLDRASMAASLEARVPLLDHRVVEFAWRIPLAMKIRKGKGKWLLRQVLHRYVPQPLVDRQKSGFGIPLDSWLRGPLKEWAEELLGERRLRNDGFFDPLLIRKTWLEHLSGKMSWQYHLWDVLMFQAWWDENRQTQVGSAAVGKYSAVV